MNTQEWICLECRMTGTYTDLRSRRDSGVDSHCGAEVVDITDCECAGCEHEVNCCLDFRQDNCYT